MHLPYLKEGKRMPKLKTIEDLNAIREQARRDLRQRQDVGTRIIIGMGDCGIAAGARETMHAILEELNRREIEAHVMIADCRGSCSKEPLVEIQVASQPRITYSNVHPDMVPCLIEEHLIRGRVIEEWTLGQVPSEGIGQC